MVEFDFAKLLSGPSAKHVMRGYFRAIYFLAQQNKLKKTGTVAAKRVLVKSQFFTASISNEECLSEFVFVFQQ